MWLSCFEVKFHDVVLAFKKYSPEALFQWPDLPFYGLNVCVLDLSPLRLVMLGCLLPH